MLAFTLACAAPGALRGAQEARAHTQAWKFGLLYGAQAARARHAPAPAPGADDSVLSAHPAITHSLFEPRNLSDSTAVDSSGAADISTDDPSTYLQI